MPFIKVYNKKKEVYTPHQTFELFLFVSVEGSGHMKFCLKSPKKNDILVSTTKNYESYWIKVLNDKVSRHKQK